MTDVDTRVTPSLHPLVFGESDDPLVREAASRFDTAYHALIKLHDARETARSSPLLTKEAATLKTADLADKTSKTVTSSLDAARKSLEAGADAIRRTLNQPLVDDGARINAEIRAHAKSLSTDNRWKMISTAIEENDSKTLRAILGGPAYLSGLDPEAQKALTVKANMRREPAQSARLRHIEDALKRVDRISIVLVMEQVEKGLGAKWTDVQKLREKQQRLERAFR
jgi:hypothetical protein